MSPISVAVVGNSSTVVDTVTEELQHFGESINIVQTVDKRVKCHAAVICPVFVDTGTFEKIRRIRQLDRALPIILIGKVTSQYDIVEAFRLGVNDFLFPPLQPGILLNCIYRFHSPSVVTSRAPWWKRLLSLRLWRKKENTLGIVEPSMTQVFDISPQAERTPVLQVHFLGEFCLSLNGHTICILSGKKTKSVLAYILHQHPRPVHREVLIDVFWKDSIPDAARNCLNVTIHAIRRNLKKIAPDKNILIFRNECYGIDADLCVEKDTDLFRSYWNKARRTEATRGMKAAVDTYHQAFAFYRGEFLEQMLYEEWTHTHRDWFSETWIVILDRLANHFFENQQYQMCLNLCQRMLEKDPCLESIHCCIMACYMKMNMKDMAMRQFSKCRQALREGLDIVPGKSTCDLYNKIKSF